VRADPALRAVRLVVITGLVGDRYAGRALREGANAVLMKPFSNPDLVEMIELQLKGVPGG